MNSQITVSEFPMTIKSFTCTRKYIVMPLKLCRNNKVLIYNWWNQRKWRNLWTHCTMPVELSWGHKRVLCSVAYISRPGVINEVWVVVTSWWMNTTVQKGICNHKLRATVRSRWMVVGLTTNVSWLFVPTDPLASLWCFVKDGTNSHVRFVMMALISLVVASLHLKFD